MKLISRTNRFVCVQPVWKSANYCSTLCTQMHHKLPFFREILLQLMGGNHLLPTHTFWAANKQNNNSSSECVLFVLTQFNLIFSRGGFAYAAGFVIETSLQFDIAAYVPINPL